MKKINTETCLKKRKNKEREQARNKQKNLPEEEKNNKKGYGKNRYHKMPEEKKARLKEYQKIIMRLKSLNIL